MQNEERLPRISRRDALKWFAAAAAASQFGPLLSKGQDGEVFAEGYGTDPVLNKNYKRGEVWPLTLTQEEREVVTALADFILPADSYGPAASALRVPDFIDEWVSAPYPRQVSSRRAILPGLKWMNAESQTRFSKKFAALSPKQQEAICRDICDTKVKDPHLKKGASFFSSFRSLAMGAYYGTPEGWKAIGYVGNVPLPTFDGPPQEVLDRVGVEQTVKS